MPRIKRINSAFGKRLMLFLAISICFCGLSFAVDRYVALTGTNNSPYLNWPDAATNIQDAIDVSTTNGDTVLVSNGTYVLTNQITVNKANLVLRSFKGRDVTVIDANHTNRCMLISGADYAVVDGFTLTNGTVIGFGGGLYTDAINLSVSNCIIAGNACSAGGGGVFMDRGKLQNCTISGNSIDSGAGGGIWVRFGGIVTNCIINNNVSTNRGCGGMGVCMESPGTTLANCLIANNSSGPSTAAGWGYGGGINMTAGLVQNCIICNNYIWFMSGGIYSGGGTVQNCIIISNQASVYAGGATLDGTTIFRNNLVLKNKCFGSANLGGGGIWIYTSNAIVANCTVVSNSVTGANSGGGVLATVGGSCSNMIIYDNYSSVDPNFGTAGTDTGYCSYSSSYPLITNGVGNITNNPQFVDSAADNYRLNMSSPCVNRGTNQSWMTNAVDLDGGMRIRYGRVDIGAYERIYGGTFYKFH